MRFLDTSAGCSGTLIFKDVAESDLAGPQYAILSHRWGADADEVTYLDVHGSIDTSRKRGHAKLVKFCKEASKVGCIYGWADTCCIKKEDSSELTEAINSMYRWYQRSHKCIVYLHDVTREAMMDSDWFTRGWTLQELIGASEAYFFDRDWERFGTKSELLARLSIKTRIPETVLSDSRNVSTCSVAQILSWAAGRKTKRDEDIAYSLLGILGVTMDSRYGEGTKAFVRLQQAIMHKGKDESMFAWAMEQEKPTGLFAPSPDSYSECTDVLKTRGSLGFSESNGELSIKLKILPHGMETYYAILNCRKGTSTDKRIAILLSRLSTDGEYVRVKGMIKESKTMIPLSDMGRFEERRLRVPIYPTEPPLKRFHGFWLRSLKPPNWESCQSKILSRRVQPWREVISLEDHDLGTAGIVYMAPKVKPELFRYAESGWSHIHWIKLGFDTDFNPMLLLANDKHLFEDRRIVHNKPDPKLFEEALVCGARSTACDEMFNNTWIKDPGGVPGKSYGWATGVAVLKVERNTGISGRLEALNLGISISLCSVRDSDMRLTGGEIWAVDIFDDQGSDPDQDLAYTTKRIESAEQDDMCASCCLGVTSHDADALRAKKQEALRPRRFLGASDLEELKLPLKKTSMTLPVGITDGHMTVRPGQMFSDILTLDVST